ncbi:unnamed protein product [Dicrocoelium dendriticum]|nr:unnamed protein product [Dicrocoelium dendriticum]
MSPNFLDSHIARSASCLTPDTPKSTRCPRQSHQIGCLKLSPSHPRLGRTHMDKSALTRLSTRVSMRGTRHPNGLSSNNTRSTPPAQAQRNMTLHSYFKQWQFKDTD